MKIEYFCFSVPNLETTDDIINEDDDENTIWVKTKENELIESAKKNNILMLFDRSSKKFYVNGEEVDVRDKVIFPRSYIPYEEELLTYLEDNGAISIQTKEDTEKIMNWPQMIQPTHRKVIETTYKDFQENVEYYKSIFNNIFLKTAKKSNTHCILKYYGYINIKGEKFFYTKPTLWNLSLEDSILLSDAFESIDDEENDTNCREYRIFVINNTLVSISRSYVDYPTIVSDNVKSFALEQINKISSIEDFPNSYVLDIGEVLMDGKQVIDIIEFNPVSSSGLEVNNLLVDELVNRELPQKPLVRKRVNQKKY